MASPVDFISGPKTGSTPGSLVAPLSGAMTARGAPVPRKWRTSRRVSQSVRIGPASQAAPVKLASDQRPGPRARGLQEPWPHAVIADQRIRHHHHLPGIRGVREHLLVPGHAGVEDHLALSVSRPAAALALEHKAVFQRKNQGICHAGQRGQQIRGSGSPIIMSITRVPPKAVRRNTMPGGSVRISPIWAACSPSG